MLHHSSVLVLGGGREGEGGEESGYGFLFFHAMLSMCLYIAEPFSLDLETKIGELNAKRVTGVLIGSANTQRTCVPSYRILEHVQFMSCLNFTFDLPG